MTLTPLPTRRPDLILDRGVLEDPRSGEYYTFGPQEEFLLTGLDGRISAAELARAFEAEFAEPLPAEDLAEFVELVGGLGLLAAAPTDDETADLAAEPSGGVADTLRLAASDTQELPAVALPARRGDLVVRQMKDDGSHVVKDPVTGQFFDLGPEESFLLLALDGKQTAETLAAGFEARF